LPQLRASNFSGTISTSTTGGCMRKSYVALVAAAGFLLTIGASAEAAGRSGGVTTPFVPHGLTTSNPGFMNGNKGNNITATTPPAPGAPAPTKGYGPSGWSNGTQGNANAPDPWKGISSPPGLK
jgi:hypothetical protein